MAEFNYGGQAVLEGVMMRGPKNVAVAVRKPGGDVVVDCRPVFPFAERYPLFKRPIFRGVVALVESLVLGMRTITYSANVIAEEEGEEIGAMEIALTVILSIALAVLLFIVLPTVTVAACSDFMSLFWQNIVEGVLRILIFLAYVYVISRMKDIKRVFQYHGAEHKVIHAFEAGEDLSRVENIQKYSTLHPRCGTAFLLIVMVLTIFFFSFLGSPSLLWRILSRLLILPLVAGVAYEFLKFTARNSSRKWVAALMAPGLWLQKLTTGPPDASMVEVAVQALKAVLPPEEERQPDGGACATE